MMQTAIKALGAGATDIQAVTTAVKGLNAANTAAVLSTTALSEVDQIAILVSKDLTKEEAKQALAAASASASTGVLAAVQGTAAAGRYNRIS